MELTEAAARTESAKMKSPVQAMTLAALARAEQAIGHAARAAELALQAGDRAARLAIPGEPRRKEKSQTLLLVPCLHALGREPLEFREFPGANSC